MTQVTVVGGGLAGAEAAWQLAEAGLAVELIDMKPEARSAAHTTDDLAELVCSNSLRSSNPENAVGLLKEEMRRLGSLVMRSALATRVPAGDALAVDRRAFSRTITEALERHARIRRRSLRLDAVPEPAAGEVILATGPLTAPELAADLARLAGGDKLYFYDAIAPIVAGDSIDRDIVFAASRYGKGSGDDYLNCPMDKEQYEAFVQAVLTGEHMPLHAFEKPRYFQGCMPIEVVAASGVDALRFGAMKPVGLRDPRTDRRPYAVVQLRREDAAGQAHNLVGFQTKLKHPEQQRILRTIPGLEHAEFLRLGAIHRNTFIDSPTVLDERMRLRARPTVRLAGQITGVEGYIESAAHGLITALLLASDLRGQALQLPPGECALGALLAHVSGKARLPGRPHEPQNVNWSMMPPPPPGVRKHEAKAYRVKQATASFDAWARASGIRLMAPAAPPESPQ
jgi:methylenetetrahydrofolate--tRNA-(uracil-5-)-methyltransferase